MRAAPLVGVLVALLGTPACFFYPDSSERTDDDLVITAFSPKADFSKYKTFAINPDVKLLETEADGDIEPGEADEDIAGPTIDSLIAHMEARGFKQVDNKDEADLGLTVTAIQGLVIGVDSYGYWGGYYGYYWGYPGWGYYYPYNVYYSYEPGTIIVDAADLIAAREKYPDGIPTTPPPSNGNGNTSESEIPDEGPGPGGIPVAWTMAGYRAYIDDSDAVVVSQIKAAIDQAFKQSPYLKAGK
ncbi:MAG TPA: DUF4136 domain-containing protein [Polyangiales bacterium]|nr:DUF4136 domain-containing protein [Polyangiales bacterium]